MNKNRRITINFIYLFLAIIVAVYQSLRIINASSSFNQYISSRATFPYLILLFALPIIILFFILVPALFVVKVQVRVNLYFNIPKPRTLVETHYTYNLFNKPKQSSLQVFRCWFFYLIYRWESKLFKWKENIWI